MTPLFSEILEKVAKAKTKEKKVKILKEHDTEALRIVLKGAFAPSVEWKLPEGEVPYVPNDAPAGTEHTVLSKMARTLFHYVNNDNPKITQKKREMMVVHLLEGLHHSEAELMVDVKDQNLSKKYKGLSSNVVKEAFNWDDNYYKKS